MVQKLSVTIALEGAEEIKRQLAEVGKAGQQAFADINKAAAEVGGFNKLDPGAVAAQLAKAGVTGADAINKINVAVKQAGRMETLVNGIAAVERGFVSAGVAIKDMGAAMGFVLPSARTMARLLVAAFGAATVGAIVSTTKALRELDAAAIKAGVSIETMAKARAIFEAIGLSSKSAAAGVDSFQANLDKVKTDNVKKAAEAVDEFGRSTQVLIDGRMVDALQFLIDHMNDLGEGGDLARKKLQEIGKLRISGPAEDIDRINQSALSTPDKMLGIIGVLEKMGNTAERNRLVFANFSKEFGAELIQALNAGGVSVEDLKKKLAGLPASSQDAANAATRLALEWEKFKTVMGSPFTVNVRGLETIAKVLQFINEQAARFSTAAFRQQAQADLAAVVGFFSALPGQIAGFFASFGTDLWANVVQSAQMTINQIVRFFSALPGQIAGFFSGFGAGLWDGIVQGAQAAWDKIVGFIERAIEKVRAFLGMGGGQAAGAGAQGFARGGIIGGRGSGTSDSNLAWLSRGEHVMPAGAVRAPGVLAFLEALRRSGGNLRGVLDNMGRFALGGLVGAPAFATGGINGMSHVTIAFPGMPPVGGLRAPGSVVEELRRSAGLAQVRSGGRKPSRYF